MHKYNINKIKNYKCYIRSLKANIKLCGIYFNKSNKLIRLLGESNLVYQITISNNGNFECNCPYYIKNNTNCKHIYFLFFTLFKIFNKWESSNSKIYLKRYKHYSLISYDDTFINSKLNEISLLLFNKNVKMYYFKLLDQKLFELDNSYVNIKDKQKFIFNKYHCNNIESKNLKCSICLTNDNLDFSCFKCNNKFHQKCINKWIKINPTCPICRYNMNDYKDFLELLNSKYNKIII